MVGDTVDTQLRVLILMLQPSLLLSLEQANELFQALVQNY